jgi:membrane protease YdiL (CAAX protease family)
MAVRAKQKHARERSATAVAAPGPRRRRVVLPSRRTIEVVEFDHVPETPVRSAPAVAASGPRVVPPSTKTIDVVECDHVPETPVRSAPAVAASGPRRRQVILASRRPIEVVDFDDVPETPVRSLAPHVAVSVVLLAAGEAIVAFAGVLPGALWQAVVLFGLMQYGLVEAGRAEGGGEARAGLFAALALVPLLRLLSLALATDDPVVAQTIVGLPLATAALLVLRRLGWQDLLALPPAGRRLQQARVALAGVPLSLSAYLLIEPAPLPGGSAALRLLAAAAAILLFGAALEELIFRGLVQRSVERVWPRAGVVASSWLFAAVHLGAGSAGGVVVYAGAGILFGVSVRRTGLLAGVIVAHGILDVGAFVIWPLVLG